MKKQEQKKNRKNDESIHPKDIIIGGPNDKSREIELLRQSIKQIEQLQEAQQVIISLSATIERCNRQIKAFNEIEELRIVQINTLEKKLENSDRNFERANKIIKMLQNQNSVNNNNGNSNASRNNDKKKKKLNNENKLNFNNEEDEDEDEDENDNDNKLLFFTATKGNKLNF